jgi:Tol biopolymer transport system component
VLIAIGGCGFHVGAAADSDARVIDGTGEDGSIPAADAMIDGVVAASCLDRWLDNTIRFDPPAAITAVNSTSFERDPFLSPDELTLYVSTARAGSLGGDTWVATRANLASTFTTPVRSTTFSTAGNETKTSITADGLYAVVGSDQAGGAGGVDVWEVSRANAAAAWGSLSRAHVMMVDTTGSDHDPMISADGLHLYTAPDSPAPQHISMATRPNTMANFGASVKIAELDSGLNDGDPAVSTDERIIVFYSSRTSAFTGGNLWYATRSSATAPFGTPRIVPDVNSSFNDGDPHLSSDGCRLYFGRDGGAADWDLYVAAAR